VTRTDTDQLRPSCCDTVKETAEAHTVTKTYKYHLYFRPHSPMNRPHTPSVSPIPTSPPAGLSNRPLLSPLRPSTPSASNPPSGTSSPRRVSGNALTTQIASASMGASAERPKSRARDLLRKHYGLGVGPPPPSGKPTDPMDLGVYYDFIFHCRPPMLCI